MAITRVEARVRQQGHHVPDDIVQRRYQRGLNNFFNLYMPIANTWQMLYNASAEGPILVASGSAVEEPDILLPDLWEQIKTQAKHA
jgi:predicted ABC-type ATPase